MHNTCRCSFLEVQPWFARPCQLPRSKPRARVQNPPRRQVDCSGGPQHSRNAPLASNHSACSAHHRPHQPMGGVYRPAPCGGTQHLVPLSITSPTRTAAGRVFIFCSVAKHQQISWPNCRAEKAGHSRSHRSWSPPAGTWDPRRPAAAYWRVLNAERLFKMLFPCLPRNLPPHCRE